MKEQSVLIIRLDIARDRDDELKILEKALEIT